MNNVIIWEKFEGETPLQAIERFRLENKGYEDISITYAGRLDPMASGLLLLLAGEKVHEKEHFLGLDKEYEVDILLGFGTDTGDILGLNTSPSSLSTTNPLLLKEGSLKMVLETFIGKQIQEYPMYSSKTVDGKQLWQYAREGKKPAKVSTKEVEIYDISLISQQKLNKKELTSIVFKRIARVVGDFRQQDVQDSWEKVLETLKINEFSIISMKVRCSSGTYMRVLAQKIGEKLGFYALAWRIKRTKIGGYSL
jgi:tRNA pseudouridine55 synthase